MYDFGKRLKLLRKQIPLSQQQLAHQIGVVPSLISSYENGSRFPSCEVLLQLSHTFHVSVDYLLGQEIHASILVNDLTDVEIITLCKLINEMRKRKI